MRTYIKFTCTPTSHTYTYYHTCIDTYIICTHAHIHRTHSTRSCGAPTEARDLCGLEETMPRIHTYIYTHIHLFMHASMYIYTHTSCTHTNTHTHTYICNTYVYIYTHTLMTRVCVVLRLRQMNPL